MLANTSALFSGSPFSSNNTHERIRTVFWFTLHLERHSQTHVCCFLVLPSPPTTLVNASVLFSASPFALNAGHLPPTPLCPSPARSVPRAPSSSRVAGSPAPHCIPALPIPLLHKGPKHLPHSTVSSCLQYNKTQGMLEKWSQEESRKQGFPALQEDFIRSRAEEWRRLW